MLEQSRWHGTFAFVLGLLAICVLVATLGIWGTQAQIAGAVIASGIVEVESNTQVVQAPEAGVVKSILVDDGDFVSKGEIILILDEADLISEQAILSARNSDITAQIERLQAERDDQDFTAVSNVDNRSSAADDSVRRGEKHLFDARYQNYLKELEILDEKIQQAVEQISGIDAQQDATLQQIAISEEEIATSRQLFENHLIKATTLRAQESGLAKLQGELGSLASQRALLLSTIAAFELDKVRLAALRRENVMVELRKLEGELTELIERLDNVERKLTRLHIASPVEGIVFGLTLSGEQAVVLVGDPLMYIVPQNQPLRIAAAINAADVDQARVGQLVSIKFSSLDQNHTPDVTGRLETIAADSAINEGTGLPSYDVLISVSEVELEKLGDQKVLPGMPAEAFIRTGERSPLSYLTKPLADHFRRAFREN